MRMLSVVAAILTTCLQPLGAASPSDWMLQLTLQGQVVEGTPLAWDRHQVCLLGRDGRLWAFPPEEAKDFRKTSSRFRSYSPSELRAALLRELGQGYEVSGTGHYLVAHPRGQRDLWAERFEDRYRSLVHYFSVRGLKLSEPAFPLIGIVCRDRQEFLRCAAMEGLTANTGVLGWYLLDSNRILLYDLDGQSSARDNWEETAATLIHEATHQIAFNTGIHSRYTPPPVWVAEGLATLSEAPGVYDGRYHTSRSDRINRDRLRRFQQLAPRHRPELIRELVASDRLFEVNPAAAYAEAWALTFYLMETEPRKYAAYLARTAAHPPFQEVAAEERLADFTSVFGDKWQMLEAAFLRFMKGVE